MVTSDLSVKPQIDLLDWVKAHSQLPGQKPTSQIAYPEQGSHHLALIEENHFWFGIRRQLVLEELRRYVGATGNGLDIGCGSGYNSLWMSERSYPTLGIDAHSIQRPPNSKSLGFLQGDIFSITPKPEFDFILLLDVIEHIEDDKKFLLQCLKFLKPGGVAIVTVPALMMLWSSVDKNSGHYRRYSKSTLSSLVSSVGAKIEKQYYFYGSLLLPYIASRFLSKFRSKEATTQQESLPSPLINKTFKMLLDAESRLTSIGGLPVGSSLFAVIKL